MKNFQKGKIINRPAGRILTRDESVVICLKRKQPRQIRNKIIFVLIILAVFCARTPGGAAQDGKNESASADAVPAEDKEILYVALTFDDGPRRSTTARLLDGLKARGARCTFFLLGSRVEGNEDLVLRMEAEGHQVGIHTYDHTILRNLCRRDFDLQVDRTRTILQEILFHDDFPLRPPCGFLDRNVQQWAGAPIILWSVDPVDWCSTDTAKIVCSITKKTKDGDIVLMHDFYPTSVDAALQVIDFMQEEGAVFVTVEELFSKCGCALENGKVYSSAGKTREAGEILSGAGNIP